MGQSAPCMHGKVRRSLCKAQKSPTRPVPDNAPKGERENRKNWGEMGGKRAKWGNVETRGKLRKDMGENSSPISPIFPHAIAQYTHPMCPISTESHRFPPFFGWSITVVPLRFPKMTHLPLFPPFSHTSQGRSQSCQRRAFFVGWPHCCLICAHGVSGRGGGHEGGHSESS